ncbi:PEP-CTERM sorting domain-containing protein [Mariniblastus fucicola]|uniref:Ice-binding protein C-terminal domain-containing protein n=1 Tax=Mariniblastus fucicola TaxID=980251 RepID=A0A5B9PCK6_9BACT|nr:PEP-CTERM sorting domain-containing protein [Mariniblastus fucicola]QEG20841.1 hypothetical protein MFFC18_06920 [Mariniblastus fucicola]
MSMKIREGVALNAKKLSAFGLAFTLILTGFSQEGRCDVMGSTYSIGATVFTDDIDGDGFLDAGFFADDGAAEVTFDGTSKAIGNFVFGNAGDQLFVEESLDVTGDTFTVTVFAVGRDSSGNLTTWVADGTTTDHDGDLLTAEVPFTTSFFGLAASNGGTDALEVNTGGLDYTFVSSEALLVGFDEADLPAGGTVLSFGDGPTSASGPSGLFAANVGFNGSPDLAGPADGLAGFGNLSIAGYGFSWTYTLTAVPEPSSAIGILLLGLTALGSRRRS